MDAFERVPIGRTAVRPTRLGLGLAPIGGLYTEVGDAQAHATVQRGWDLGIRFFDVAPLYGYGLSEQRAGDVLSTKPRDDYVLSTKVDRLLRPRAGNGDDIWAERTGLAPVYDFSAGGVHRSYAESLERMGVDRADMLHLHDPEPVFAQARDEGLPALAALRAEGRVGAISAGMNVVTPLDELVSTGRLDCVLLAGRHTLLDRSAAAALLPLCARLGVSVIAAGVFNSGLLADPRPGATFDYAPVQPGTLRRALRMGEICRAYGIPLRAAALQFPLTHPAVAVVLVGVRSPAEVDDAVAMAAVDVPNDLWRELETA